MGAQQYLCRRCQGGKVGGGLPGGAVPAQCCKDIAAAILERARLVLVACTGQAMLCKTHTQQQVGLLY